MSIKPKKHLKIFFKFDVLMDFLSPPQQLLQLQHNDAIRPQVPLPQHPQQLTNSVRQSLSPIQNQQLDSWMARMLFTPSDGSSSLNLERELKLIMTPPRKQQQQQHLAVFGERPIIPTLTRNPGVGRPPGSSTDGVFVPVS